MRVLEWRAGLRLDGPGPGQALIFGGFGAGADVLRPLAGRLNRLGLTVEVAALARHTGDQALFERSRTWHYYSGALRHLQAVARTGHRPVVLGGYSTGALLAIILAARHPEQVDALLLLSPVLRTARLRTQVVGYTVGTLYYAALPLSLLTTSLALVVHARRHRWRMPTLAWRLAGSAAVFATAGLGLRRLTVPLRSGGPMELEGELVVPPHFTRTSLVAGATLVPLQLVARARLPHLTVPTCAIFGEADDVVDVGFGVDLTRRLVPGAEVHVVARAPHRVVAVPECLDIAEGFVSRILAGRAVTTSRGSPPAPAR